MFCRDILILKIPLPSTFLPVRSSISLELVSRGCSRVISVEADRDHANFIRQCFQKLGEDKDILIRGDVFRFLKTCKQKFDFIFADPPYALKELPQIQTSF